jgi:hypothetical protein
MWNDLSAILGSVMVGTIVALVLGWAILRIQKRPLPYPAFLKRYHLANKADSEPVKVELANSGSPGGLFRTLGSPEMAGQPAIDVKTSGPGRMPEFMSDLPDALDNAWGASERREEAQPGRSDIRVEIEKDRDIAIATLMGKMIPFETRVWDTYGAVVKSVPLDLHEELRKVYADMRLANTLVWLSRDAGRKSDDLDETHLKLCGKIAERLQRVITTPGQCDRN